MYYKVLLNTKKCFSKNIEIITEQHPIHPSIHPYSLVKRALQGAGLSFILLSGFLMVIYFTSGGDVGLGIMIFLPYATVTLGRTFGGVFYYLMDYLRYLVTWQKVVANIISFDVYFVSLWLSLVFALSITGYWD